MSAAETLKQNYKKGAKWVISWSCMTSRSSQCRKGKISILMKLKDEVCSWTHTMFQCCHAVGATSQQKYLLKCILGPYLDKWWLHWINEFLRLNSPCGASALIWRVNSIALGSQTSAIFRHKFMLAHINFDVWIRITASLAILLVPRQLCGLCRLAPF